MVSHLRSLLSELRRRKVLGVAVGYAILAWGVLEVSSTVLQMAEAPGWIGKVVLAIVALGFPVALVLAWFFDLSSTGLVRTAPAADEQPAQARGVRILAAVLILGISALFTAFAFWLRPDSSGEPEFTQLTNFADAATAPALSPDGRMLAFLKGGPGFFGNSANPSQVYVKQLPDGDEVQLTDSRYGKATPTFSLDGSRVYFTATVGNFKWDTHVVSVNGGHESELLPNASGLSFLDTQNVLFAQIAQGVHMGIRRATVAREGVRDVYWPNEEGSMAHRAAASPDRQWVLLAEMDAGVWSSCRLVPFDGSSPGRKVGPPASQCTYAAWSPDGRWMYFTADAGGKFHIWRQRFPKGEPELLTNGPTEEEGIAVAPDGGSLITSAGVRYNSIWLIDEQGDRQISVEGYAFSPVASLDGERLYFLSREGSARLAYSVGRLIATTLENGAREQLLPGHTMLHFDISADDREIVFTSGIDALNRRGIWIAPLDRSTAPRRVHAADAERVFFDAASNIYTIQRDQQNNRYLYRLRAPQYAVNERIYPDPVFYLFDVSPDGEWVAAVVNLPDKGTTGMQHVAISTRGLSPRVLCGFCGGGAGPTRVQAPAISWTRDGRALLVSGQHIGFAGMRGPTYTVVVPLRPGTALPDLPATGISSVQDYLELPGARRIPQQNVFPGATPEQLFFYEATTIRNLYRVKLPD